VEETMLKILAGSALAVLMLAATASAQPAKTQRSAASLECSKQADEQALHGKARKKFRSKCLKEAKKSS
jgi:hypothetical protein